LVHFQPLIGQVGDAPAYVHQAAQKVKLGDAPTSFHLGLNILGLGRFGCWAQISFSFYLTLFGPQVSPLEKAQSDP